MRYTARNYINRNYKRKHMNQFDAAANEQANTETVDYLMDMERGFEDYLREIHAKQYEGYDDDMPDDFNDWVSQFDTEATKALYEGYLKTLKK